MQQTPAKPTFIECVQQHSTIELCYVYFLLKTLFDISLCKCKDFLICKCKIKVPVAERAFLTDQRTSRKMLIGGIDIKATKMLHKRLKRKEEDTERREKSSTCKLIRTK
ncbi:hypothetical protein RN001_000333 [Aquatica leii]|uniref:Uncharacterized protein n=1 Tax=Aquatica leii TaxID=1421715 RepID=A0AAN7Q702_9COLE|nr:hypothetical protein RN001_000333 [Aquatica leii]